LCLGVETCRFVPELVTIYYVTWGTSVDCSVTIILAEYVLCLQFKKRQKIISQWSRFLGKLTFAHLVKNFPVLMENEHSFLLEKCLPLRVIVTLPCLYIYICIKRQINPITGHEGSRRMRLLDFKTIST
jgi:hypothetical protein